MASNLEAMASNLIATASLLYCKAFWNPCELLRSYNAFGTSNGDTRVTRNLYTSDHTSAVSLLCNIRRGFLRHFKKKWKLEKKCTLATLKNISFFTRVLAQASISCSLEHEKLCVCVSRSINELILWTWPSSTSALSRNRRDIAVKLRN